ncbi:TrlF family AAA-like ATPase [Rhizobium herbae]
MTYANGMHPGTTWRKADLQCHTPRDRNWTGEHSLPGGTEQFEAARQAWAAEYIAAAKAKGLSMVAVTDHHDICLADYIRVAAAEELDFLFFPGVEITCSDNSQCLLILDPASGSDLHSKVLGLLTNVLPAARNDAKTCVTVPIKETMADFYEKVLNDDHLREICLVFPHFSNSDGSHKSLNAVGHAQRFAGLGCDGVYIEQPVGQLEAVTLQKIRGEIADWGTKRRALIPTGDNRSSGWERLGLHDCWIKIGEPTIEGLRQALLADEARIAHSAPTEPAERILSIKISSSLCGDEPMSIRFNPGFNAIIGGRGSGKSAILEYLRFGLGRTSIDLPVGESARPKDRSASLIEETLAVDGYVEIELEREGIAETWRRELSSREKIVVTDVAGTSSTLTLADAQQKFPARAFDQKGLSSTMNDLTSAAEQITGIAAAEEVEQRREIDRDIATAKRSVTLALQQLAAYWLLQLDSQRKTAILHETQVRATNIAERLKTDGVSMEALAIIDESPRYTSGASFIQAVETAISTGRSAITDTAEELLADLSDVKSESELPVVAGLRQEATRIKESIRKRLQECLADIGKLEAVKDIAKTAFGDQHRTHKEKYDAAILEQEKHRAIIDENARLAESLEAAKNATALAEKEVREAGGAVAALTEARTNLSDKLTRRRNVLSAAAEKVAGHSSGVLKARLKTDSVPDEYVSSVTALLAGSRVQDSSEKTESWVSELLKANSSGAWTSVCDQILEIYKQKILAGSPAEPGTVLSKAISDFLLGGDKLTSFAAGKVYSLLTDATVGATLSACPRDFIVLTYVDANGKAISFEKASEGQQASALLELLLSQSAGTLVIDQPEDDLDNNVVMRIVEMIRSSKSNRQLIFATHNPNMVVNGDADKIIALASTPQDPRPNSAAPRISIHADGAIETVAVKSSITHIMEGGEAAFDLRRRKYRFGAV